MKIGFVAEPYEEANASGMGYVVRELLKHIVAEGKDAEVVVYCSRPVNKDIIPGTYREVRIPHGFIKQFWFFWRMQPEVDFLLFNVPLLPYLTPKKIKTILICQELLSQKVAPKSLRDRVRAIVRDQILMPLCLKRATKVVAASGATESDLYKFYKTPKEKVAVVYDGFQKLERFKDEAAAPDPLRKPYFLFVGVVKYRKNVHGIVSAFIQFKERTKSDAKLRIAGGYGPGEYYDGIVKELREHNLESEVSFAGYITGPQLYALYRDASALVFPSINEGFGMPTVEAMSLGIPVITSKISSMVEVAGGAAKLVDPFNVADISRAMEEVLSNQEIRNELIAKGYERAKVFSWDIAAQEFLRLMREST